MSEIWMIDRDFLKAFFCFVFLSFSFHYSVCQSKFGANMGLTYISAQYDIFHNVGVSLKKNNFSINQQLGLSHKYLVIKKFNWRIQENISYFWPISKRFAFENGVSLGFCSQMNNSRFYQLDENLYLAIHFRGFLGVFWRNYIGIMQQMKGTQHLYTTLNLASQIGISHEF
ncbi:MAG: hypothetical protein FJY17_10590 [Bacteroidetes bacterium]|nr:hypothetical protein [Bacteroidota bacterium]